MAKFFITGVRSRGVCRVVDRHWAVAALLTAGLLSTSAASAPAADHSIDLLRALQERGYGDTAVMLINRLEQQKKLPREMVETIDLEKSKSLRLAARTAYSAEKSQQLLATAQQHLDKFLKEHPDHPEVAKATLAGADFLLDKAIEKLFTAKSTTDKTEQAKLMAQARKELDACGPRFDDALKRYQAQRAEVMKKLASETKKTPTAPTMAQKKLVAERSRIEYGIVECRFKGAMLNYQIAQTFLDLKHADRTKALKQAYDELDDIYNLPNTQVDVKLQAHFWKGKATEDLGDGKTALIIYEEVLGGEQPGASAESLEFYTNVLIARLKLLSKRGGHNEIVAEADEWFKEHRNWTKAAFYQGVVLEVSKAIFALSEKGKPADKARLQNDAQKLLKTAVAIESPYQNEIALLLNGLGKASPTGPATTFEEHIAVGKKAGFGEKWAEANVSFTQALELANKSKKAVDIKEAQGLLSLVQFKIAIDLHKTGKFAECLELSKQIARVDKSDNSAAAAGLALHTSYGLYVKVLANAAAKDSEKTAALEEVQANAKFLLDNWPGGAEADEARFMLAGLVQKNGNIEGAIKFLGEINPESKRYGGALAGSAQLYWGLYRKAKAEENADPAKLAALKKEVVDRLVIAVAELSKPGTDESLADALLNSQMLLSFIYLDEQKPAEAVKLLEPLFLDIKTANPPKAINDSTVKIFSAAAKAYIAIGGPDGLTKAGNVAETLLELGTDDPAVNKELIDFAKTFDKEIRDAQAVEIASPEFSAKTLARAKIEGCRKVQVKLIDGLSPREKLTAEHIIYLASTCQSLGMNKQSRELYNKITKMAAENPATVPKNQLTYVLAKLIGLLREEGKYEQAIMEVDKLIASNERVLEPLITKAEILQSWAQKDPKKYDECVQQWLKIRSMLQGSVKKPKAYYDAIYNAATCLVAQSKATNDKAKALEAEKTLRYPMTLTPNLNGPDTVAKYEALLKQAQQLQAK